MPQRATAACQFERQPGAAANPLRRKNLKVELRDIASPYGEFCLCWRRRALGGSRWDGTSVEAGQIPMLRARLSFKLP